MSKNHVISSAIFNCIVLQTETCSRFSLHWRHNGLGGVWNHQRIDCLLSRLFRCRSKKTSKLLVIGLCEGNPPVTGEFPSQRASNADNVSIWWRHHVVYLLATCKFPSRWRQMTIMASRITGQSSVCSSIVYTDNKETSKVRVNVPYRVRGIDRWSVDSMQKGKVTWKIFPFDDVTMPCFFTW